MAILADGSLVTAPLALTRLLRLQQITSGFVPVDTLEDVDEIPYADLGKTNPRLEKLEATCKASTEKRIIWCRFRRSIEKVTAMLGNRAVRYDGTTSEDDRVQAIQDIQKGDKQFFVANAATAGEGLTLTAAKFSDYYENTFDLAARLQSEDRNHRIGQDRNVGYNDYIAKAPSMSMS
jgi:SNF2 family DNA or RNA helicase